jgi:hypothetical protein
MSNIGKTERTMQNRVIPTVLSDMDLEQRRQRHQAGHDAGTPHRKDAIGMSQTLH